MTQQTTTPPSVHANTFYQLETVEKTMHNLHKQDPTLWLMDVLATASRHNLQEDKRLHLSVIHKSATQENRHDYLQKTFSSCSNEIRAPNVCKA